MSQQEDDLHAAQYLSWRKMHLSRAKLKASSKTSALLSGFAMVAMVELEINAKDVPRALLITFIFLTILLVALHMLALMISTCILPHIETLCAIDQVSLAKQSPHEFLHWYIEAAWVISTLVGLLLFLVQLAILCWFKFIANDSIAAWSGSIILIPILLVFLVFAAHFYKSLATHKYNTALMDMAELEMLKEKMEQGDIESNSKLQNGLQDGIQTV